jgi:hypothetical protein
LAVAWPIECLPSDKVAYIHIIHVAQSSVRGVVVIARPAPPGVRLARARIGQANAPAGDRRRA